MSKQSHPAPNVHERALLTWLAIFPLVAIGLSVLGAALGEVHPVIKALILTLIVVPLSVYVVVPFLMKIYFKIQLRITNPKV